APRTARPGHVVARSTSTWPMLTSRSSVRSIVPSPPGPWSTTDRWADVPFATWPSRLTSPIPARPSTATSAVRGTITWTLPTPADTFVRTSCLLRSTFERSRRTLPTPTRYSGWISAAVDGSYRRSPTPPLNDTLDVLTTMSASSSGMPSQVSQRARPNQAPTSRPAPIVPTETASRSSPSGSIAPAAVRAAATPRTTSSRQTVIIPSAECSRGAAGAGGGGTATVGAACSTGGYGGGGS